MSNFLNSGLNKVGISKEDKTEFGVPSKAFPADDVFYFEQDLENPVNPTDTINKVVKKSTRAKQIQSQGDLIEGRSDVSVNFSNNISKNDFMTVFAPMFFQHSYEYVPTITTGTFVSVTSVVDVVTIEPTTIGTLKDGDFVNITGRTVNTDENDEYEVSNVTATTFDIEFVGGFDVELEGLVEAEMNTHKAVFEDNTSCNKHELDSSFTFYMPYGWDKTTCSDGKGDIVTGLVAKSGSVDFVTGAYTIDMIGSDLIEDSTNLPIETDYIEPITDGGFFNIDSPIIKDSLGNIQDCSALTMNIERTVTEDLRTFRGGKLARAVVDGTMITGTYSLLFGSEDELNNHSSLIYSNRKSLQNGGTYTIGLESSDGSSIAITGEMIFMNEQKNKVVGGWELSTDYEMLYGKTADNITVEVVNGINQTIAELYNTEA